MYVDSILHKDTLVDGKYVGVKFLLDAMIFLQYAMEALMTADYVYTRTFAAYTISRIKSLVNSLAP